MKRHIALTLINLLLTAVVAQTVAAADSKPNVLFIAIDDLRPEMTVQRDRHDGSVAATELYDEQNDPAESKNLADAHADVVARLREFLPAMPLFDGTAKNAKPESAKPKQDRAALFEKKDKNHDGKLTFKEFMENQPDPEAAKKRSEQWDADNKGYLTRDEFINMGGKSK